MVVEVKKKLGYDDSLDVFGIHGMAGTWGIIANGLFANPKINPLGTGLFLWEFKTNYNTSYWNSSSLWSVYNRNSCNT